MPFIRPSIVDHRQERNVMGHTGKALSRTATQLPLTAISLSLQAWERSRPLRDFALRRGSEALQIAAHTPLGRLLPKQIFDDGADEEAAGIVADARQKVTPAESKPAPKPTPKPAAAASTPKPAAPKPVNAAAREVGAPGAVTEEVEQIAETLHVEAPQSRDELPIPDFDNISIGSLRARLRPLTVEQLVTLREWEQAHANRLNVITTLDNRIAKLGTTAKANGSSGDTAQTDVGPAGTAYPQEAKAAERAAEDEGGTLRV
jgi:hypothetical protein